MTNEAGQSLLDAFKSIAVINLAHRRDRLREVSDQLARIELTFVHGQVAVQPAYQFSDACGFQTAGARGCFESHLAVWRRALAEGRSATLLFEDDLDFVPGARTLIPNAMKALSSAGWSVFYGGILSYDGQLASPISLADPSKGVLGGHFVALRRPAIERIVPYLEAIVRGTGKLGPMHVDGAYSHFRAENPDLETWIANPVLGVQRPSRTDIHALKLFDRLPLVRNIATSARWVKRQMQR